MPALFAVFAAIAVGFGLDLYPETLKSSHSKV